MQIRAGEMLLPLLCYLLLAGGCAITSTYSFYDYSASIECLDEPLAPHYGGGLIQNADFEAEMVRLDAYGSADVSTRKSSTGNTYVIASKRLASTDSFGLMLDIHKDIFYTFSAWIQLDNGNEVVSAFASDTVPVIIGSVAARSGCWSMLKGGFTLQQDMKTSIYFQCKNTSVEIWTDNISLKSHTRQEWRGQQDKSIDQVRKRKVRIHVTTKEGKNVEGANVVIDQTKPYFHIGCASTSAILTNKAYEDWFASRFTATTFNNEMKWYYIESQPGLENYTDTDAMVSLFKKHGISIRGHAILWNSPYRNQYWVKNLQPTDILKASLSRMASVVSRYSGDVMAWDVLNENIHYTFYDNILGPNASAMLYQIAHALDPNTPLFMNEYNTLEYPLERTVVPSKYVEKIREMRSFPGNEQLRLKIGLEGHFGPDQAIAHMRACLDVLGATNLSVWITEMDIIRGPNQASELEEVMREAFSHPAIEGMILWGGWKPTNCNQTCRADTHYDILPSGCTTLCLIDENVQTLPIGDMVDKLINEWRTKNVTGSTDVNGVFEQNVFLGEYFIKYSHPLLPGVSFNQTFYVGRDAIPLDVWVSL